MRLTEHVGLKVLEMEERVTHPELGSLVRNHSL